MNAKTITTWIAQHRVRTALIALGVILLAWDWFAIPRLLIAMFLPFFFLSLPLIFLGAPVVALVLFFRKRAQARAAAEHHGFNPQAQQAYPEALPQQAPRRLTEQELVDMYERYPERFEGVDLGDEFDR